MLLMLAALYNVHVHECGEEESVLCLIKREVLYMSTLFVEGFNYSL